MKSKSLKNNFILNIVRVFFTSFVGLFTLPYLNKTLGVDKIGEFDYSLAILNYFILFSALGMPMYAIREISIYRDNSRLRTKTLIELIIILLVTSVTSTLIFVFFIYYAFNNSSLFYILLPIILFTNLTMDWFYQGIEDQYYITVRNVVIKIISIACLFLFVKTREDLIVYAFIYSFTIIINSIVNILNLYKYIDIKEFDFKTLIFRKHIKGILIIFIGTVSISVYTQLSITILGYYGDNFNVGLYTTANKLNRFALLGATTLGAIMLPRLSSLYNEKKTENYVYYLKKSFNYLNILSFFIFTILYTNAKYIINIMAGNEFKESILLMRILSFQIIFISLSYCFAFMILYPEGKEKKYTYIVTISSIISLILSLIFVPKFFHVGTTIISLFTEFIGFLMMFLMLRKKLIEYQLVNVNFINYLICSSLSIFFNYIFLDELENDFIGIILNTFSALIIFVGFLLIARDDLIVGVFKKIKKWMFQL